jgi:GR25 family glycosyltransferase involved in LPS biosynthesis
MTAMRGMPEAYQGWAKVERMFPLRVISLTRHTKRRAQFLQRNAHLESSFFDAIDGDALSDAEIASSGLFTPQVKDTYGPHAYGAAMSHWHLWKEAAAGNSPLTIAEDDAVFRLDFAERAPGVMASLPKDWDVVLWGWNFDSLLCVRAMGAVSPVSMVFDQDQMRRSIDTFQALDESVQPFPLEQAFGLLAYTVSPAGAARLIEKCFPQRPKEIFMAAYGRYLRNVGVDVAAAAVYGQLKSFACFPPLAVSPNVRGEA